MSYKKVVLNEFGGPEVLQVVEEANLPEPGAGEVRIKILAASATFTDTMVRKGIYFGFKETPPLSPGYDMVGIVDKVGSGVSGLTPGLLVADLIVYGAYTEYMLRPADSLVPVPAELDPAEAVSMVLSYVSAYQMLHRVAKVKRGQSILVHGAGGAVGTAFLELGRQLDLKMYGTASASKRELVEGLGAEHIDYAKEDFVARLQAEGKVDAAFDAISGENFKRSFASLKKGGTLVPYGFYDNSMGKGGSVPIDFMKIMLWNILPNGRKASFYSIGDLRKKNPEWFKEDLSALFDLLKAGKIKPAIEQRMKLEDAKKAHELIEQAAVKGRIVLMVSEENV
ncbi:MAG: zinc-binding dehydrogenase [Anaerolineae bacterium]|jgi:NADPH:quinone reductase-like Zn-dependent oxidoreductase|nr:zinc-binding dehydrogenase [Anaerolineae bacterium]MBT4311157.1 zinc-binding dehydrogenase [Anaerolineae bacterium]MBT4458037.1 zinc-binding dehydrogenase [Anaerolineae bacterium]MBT4843692.1 zinc-binding dehydrogenase [Anaerolineae bacterium]MBT6061206.1 zinc-binding dehydrogenase [Anaerolineae bacterium]